MFKAQPDGQHVPAHNNYAQEGEQHSARADSNIDFEASGNEQIVRANDVDSNISQGLDVDSVSAPNEDGKV